MLLSGQMGETYEGFINTRQDLIERNMTLGQFMTYFKIYCNDFLFIVLQPGSQYIIQTMKLSYLEDYNELAHISLSLTNDGNGKKTRSLIDNEVMKQGTHAYLRIPEDMVNEDWFSYLEEKHNTVWYRSSETVLSENPHVYWLSKKKWPLNEQLNLHMLNYQEV